MNELVEPGRLIAMDECVQPSELLLDREKHVLGRLAGVCDMVIERATISRLHAQIERRGSHYVLRNLSRNPLYVNGNVVEDETILENGDTIGLARPAPLLRFVDFDPTVVVRSRRLAYDERVMTFYLDDEAISLTPSQFRLLLHLFQNEGHVCSREDCARAIWGESFLPGMDADNLDKVMSGVRSALREIDPEADFIQNRRGLGYVLAQ